MKYAIIGLVDTKCVMLYKYVVTDHGGPLDGPSDLVENTGTHLLRDIGLIATHRTGNRKPATYKQHTWRRRKLDKISE